LARRVLLLEGRLRKDLKGLSAREKAHFLDLLLDFREERAPLEAPLALLHSWALRFGQEYIEAQALLMPYPKPLMDLKSS
jgi:uncharacterized protein YbgA (DUF1722 family)